jgi:hypothetical protein
VANPKHVNRLLGVPKWKVWQQGWNDWRRSNPAVRPGLTGANLSGAILTGANLSDATLMRAHLSIANLSGANLIRADLSDADLSGADLSGATLRGANLNAAILGGANLTDARLHETVFARVDLTKAIGLETCFHHGPSAIDYRTLQKSSPLPRKFLRGVGLPDNLIEYLPSLLNQPIQHYSCFISYSTKDQEFAERLHGDLQNKGVRCWFEKHFLLTLSFFFEACVDLVFDPIASAWAAKLRARLIGDFTRWKDYDAYKQSLKRVLRDLTVKREVSSKVP